MGKIIPFPRDREPPHRASMAPHERAEVSRLSMRACLKNGKSQFWERFRVLHIECLSFVQNKPNRDAIEGHKKEIYGFPDERFIETVNLATITQSWKKCVHFYIALFEVASEIYLGEEPKGWEQS